MYTYTNPAELTFVHFIKLQRENAIFATARDEAGRSHCYLVDYEGKWIKRRIVDQWYEFYGDDADAIRQRIRKEYGLTPTITTTEHIVW